MSSKFGEFFKAWLTKEAEDNKEWEAREEKREKEQAEEKVKEKKAL